MHTGVVASLILCTRLLGGRCGACALSATHCQTEKSSHQTRRRRVVSQLFPFANRGVSPKMRDLAATRGQRRSLAVCFARASLPRPTRTSRSYRTQSSSPPLPQGRRWPLHFWPHPGAVWLSCEVGRHMPIADRKITISNGVPALPLCSMRTVLADPCIDQASQIHLTTSQIDPPGRCMHLK